MHIAGRKIRSIACTQLSRRGWERTASHACIPPNLSADVPKQVPGRGCWLRPIRGMRNARCANSTSVSVGMMYGSLLSRPRILFEELFVREAFTLCSGMHRRCCGEVDRSLCRRWLHDWSWEAFRNLLCISTGSQYPVSRRCTDLHRLQILLDAVAFHPAQLRCCRETHVLGDPAQY